MNAIENIDENYFSLSPWKQKTKDSKKWQFCE